MYEPMIDDPRSDYLDGTDADNDPFWREYGDTCGDLPQCHTGGVTDPCPVHS